MNSTDCCCFRMAALTAVAITAEASAHLSILILVRSFNVGIGDFVNEYAIFIIMKEALLITTLLLK